MLRLSRPPRPTRFACLLLVAVAGCTPKIGDKCTLSTDCSTRGDRLCDTSQPEGYCTQFNCHGNDCPAKEGSCVEFGAALPGCGYSDRSGPNGARTARTFCLQTCTSNSDCRADYVCADPRQPPWNALLLDNDQTSRVCLVRPIGWGTDAGNYTPSTAPVCGPVAPDVPPIDVGSSTPADAATDAHDAGADADASDGG